MGNEINISPFVDTDGQIKLLTANKAKRMAVFVCLDS